MLVTCMTASPSLTTKQCTLGTEDAATFSRPFAVFVSLLPQLFGVLRSQAQQSQKYSSSPANLQAASGPAQVAKPLKHSNQGALCYSECGPGDGDWIRPSRRKGPGIARIRRTFSRLPIRGNAVGP